MELAEIRTLRKGWYRKLTGNLRDEEGIKFSKKLVEKVGRFLKHLSIELDGLYETPEIAPWPNGEIVLEWKIQRFFCKFLPDDSDIIVIDIKSNYYCSSSLEEAVTEILILLSQGSD